jgi:hypothetical protein
MYCGNCGAYIGDETYCRKCGARVANARQAQPEPDIIVPGRFLEFLSGFARSDMFLVGIVLFTGGTLISSFISFSIFSLISTFIAALPVAGLWIIYANSKSVNNPERALTAISLFRGRAIIAVIMLVIMFALIIIVALFFGAIGSSSSFQEVFSESLGGNGGYLDSGILNTFLVVAAVITILSLAVGLVYSIFYYRALFDVLNGLKSNILRDEFEPVKGGTLFSILTYISVGISLITTLSSPVLLNYSNRFMESIQVQLQEMNSAFTQTLQTGAAFNPVDTITGVAADIGLLLCVITLHRLNRSILKKNYQNADINVKEN